MEVAVLGQASGGNAEHPEWRQWLPEGTDRAELPLDSQSEETRPLGMALDITSQKPIPWADNQSLPAMPILFLLSTDGLLCPFNVINLLEGAAPVNQAAQQLSVEGERPAMKMAGTLPLAASTPLGKTAVPRTNLGDRFAAIGDVSALTAPAKPTPPPQYAAPTPAPPPQYVAPAPAPPPQYAAPAPAPPPTVQAFQPPAQPPPQPAMTSQVAQPSAQLSQITKPARQEEETGMGPAARILQDEVAKFVCDLQDFKYRSTNMRVSVASQADKERLLKTTSELSDFGTELVETTRTQDEEVRSLYTELTEVAALLEDARVRYARRKNPRYSHLLKLRPLDPASRRRMDGIERLYVHIEQQLEEADRMLESFKRDHRTGPKGTARKVEIPVTQVIYEALKNNARVIAQLQRRLERINAQSKEQQLKLAGAAFEALRYFRSETNCSWYEC